VNSINLKWNSWVTSSIEMAFTCIIIRFVPLLIMLHQLLFKMSNVLLDLPTFIDVSLPTIIQLIRKDKLFSWGVEVVNVF